MRRPTTTAGHRSVIVVTAVLTTVLAAALSGCAASTSPAAAPAARTTIPPAAPTADARPSDSAHTPTGTPTGTGARTGDGTGRVTPTRGADTTAIKGWMTVQQVLDAYDVTREALYARFAVPDGTSTSTTLRDLSDVAESTFDVTDLRAWLDDGASA